MKIKSKDLEQQVIDDLNKMMEYQALNGRKISEVATRGAVIECKGGSHRRCLNLPVDHGVDAEGLPVILETDCIVGKNISNFGICAVKTMLAKTKDGFISASQIPGTVKSDAVLYGIPCTPVPTSNWQGIDENSVAWDNQELDMKGKALIGSNAVCAYGKDIGIVEPFPNLFGSDDEHKLEMHDICQFEVQEGDPIQISISENTITLDAYIKFENASSKQKKLIRKGIKQWKDIDYKEDKKNLVKPMYVYGHKAKVKIKLHEDDDKWPTTQKSILFKCVAKEDCQEERENINAWDIEVDEDGYEKRSHLVGLVPDLKYSDSKVIMLYPIGACNRYEYSGKIITDENNHEIIDIRKRTDKEITNVVTHEFGHAMGLTEAYTQLEEIYSGDSIQDDILRKGPKQEILLSDIMVKTDYDKNITISAINWQMIIAAAMERKMQFYLEDDHPKRIEKIPRSKGAVVTEKCTLKTEN